MNEIADCLRRGREVLSSAADSLSITRRLFEDYRAAIKAMDPLRIQAKTLNADVARLQRIELEIEAILADIDFRQLLGLVCDGKVVRPEQYAMQFDHTTSELAQLAGVAADTVALDPEAPQLQEFLLNSLRVLAAAIDIGGDYERAKSWFLNSPIQPLEFKTAELLVSERRSKQVLLYIDSLNAGCA